MLDDGEITEEEAKTHPYRHVITRVLGFTSEVEADIEKTEFSPTDIILLCSDGLTNMLEDSEIESVFETVPAREGLRRTCVARSQKRRDGQCDRGNCLRR